MKRTVIEYDDCKARIKARKKFLFDMDGGNRHAACSLRVFVPGNEREMDGISDVFALWVLLLRPLVWIA